MAERKKPQTTPVLDNSAVAADPNTEASKVVRELTSECFDNVIRNIKTSGLDRVRSLKTVTRDNLKRLGTKPNAKKAVSGIPKGSDHLDIGTLKTWAESIAKHDKAAIAQLVAIDATCSSRG